MSAKPEEPKTPIVRYRKGTLLRVPFDLIKALQADIGLIKLDLKQRQEKVQALKDGMGRGVAVESTWTQLLNELIQEYERASRDRKDEAWREVLRQFLELAYEDAPAEKTWPKVREFLYANIDQLSGWKWCAKRLFAGSMGVFRRDGKYFVKSEEGEAEIVYGAKTAVEERLDFTADSISSYGGLLNLCLKALALVNSEKRFRADPAAFPSSLRIELGESDHHTSFIYWRWDLRWPYTLRPTAWRPNDNHCDPQWLANDLLGYVAEREVADSSTDISPPALALVEKWAKQFGKAKQQLSFALETRLNFGKESEAWLEFRGHTYRWINRTSNSYPIAISTHAADEADRDVVLRTFKFLSHLSFQFDEGIECDFWVGTMSRFSPAVSNPFKQGSSGVPEGVFQETKGKDPKRLDFALSLYREGTSSNSVFYKMMSYFKVIQLAFGEKRKLVDAWIDANAPKTWAYKQSNFQADLAKSGLTLSEHLYEASRNAIAHVNLGSKKSVVDPDDVEHHRRVHSALPLVRQLAQEAIKQGLF